MKKNISQIMKPTKRGMMNTACSECGKDMCSLTSKPCQFPMPEFKNCSKCRVRKNGTRARDTITRRPVSTNQMEGNS